MSSNKFWFIFIIFRQSILSFLQLMVIVMLITLNYSFHLLVSVWNPLENFQDVIWNQLPKSRRARETQERGRLLQIDSGRFNKQEKLCMRLFWGSLRIGGFLYLPSMHWRRKWQPTPVFLPGESQGRGSLVGCRLWGRTESDTTEAT